MEFVIIGMGVFLALLGLMINEQNATYLLAGYNTASEKERENFDIKGYLKLFRNFHLFLGGSILVFGLATYYLIDRDWSFFFIGVYPILAYIYLVYRGRFFYKENRDKSAKLGIYILSGCLVLIVILSFYGFSEDGMNISDGSVEIEGMYGIELQRDDLIEINLLDTLPAIRAKLNGVALSNIYKGKFKTESLEKVRLVINKKQPPYIEFITSDNKKVYYSADSEKTRELFEELKGEFPELTRDYRGS